MVNLYYCEAIDIDHRLRKQQYTTGQWDLGGRKTSCMASQQNKLVFLFGQRVIH